MLVTLDDIKVMFVVSPSGPQGAGEAFGRLEARLPGLKGRKFYGTLLNGEYRACVALEPQDSPAAMGLETWTIPGGAYARRKLERWSERLPEIGQIFGALTAEYARDPARPNVEFYRSQKELLLFMAVTSRAESRALVP
ncbi:MAG TPA: GyrI-like domain-containing protein [Methylomirabilota bacterium]|nr:GyrI-like domain-containing protein [Methylomirabilota bacterium]